MEFPESESSTLEFKERIPSRDQVLKTIVGFCNLYGGRILIGVKDSGLVISIEEAICCIAEKKGTKVEGNSKSQAWVAYHLAVENQARLFPTVGGILLFISHPQKWLPEAFIICSTFAGRSGRTVLSTQDAVGSLFSQFDIAFEFIVSSLNKSFTIKGKHREEKYELPLVAIREALVNAVVHRNYALPAPIKVAIYEDRIEVFSPGIFPGPFDVNNLTTGVTYIRNTAITKVFREAGYIEKLGSGFITMIESYKSMGLKPPSVIEGENFVKCILPREKAEEETVPDDEAILRLYYRFNSITIRDVMQNLGLPRATAGRRLKEMEKKNKVQKRGRGPATRYFKAGMIPD